MTEATSLLVGVGIWEVIGATHPRLLPPVNLLASTAWRDVSSSTKLWDSIGGTMLDVLISFSAAMIIGTALALLMGVNRTAARIANMYLYWLIAVPEIAMVPFYIILFGFGLTARLVIVFFFAIPVITQRVLLGVQAVGRSLTDMAACYELSRWQVVRKVILPATTPSVFTAARLGFARAMLGIITAGFFLQLYGLGGAIYNFEQLLNTVQIFVYLGALIVISLLVTRCIQYLDAKLTPWNRSVEDA
ncbi:MAG: ABC transporter permease [Mycobacteriales bacterium]